MYTYNDKTIMCNDYYISMGKNISKLINATEIYVTFMYFLQEMRNYKKVSIKIGTFEYEDWVCDLFCHLSDSGVYFTEENHSYDLQINKKYKTLTDLCFGMSFDGAEINIDYDIINEFLCMAGKEDNNVFEDMLAETHCEFW